MGKKLSSRQFLELADVLLCEGPTVRYNQPDGWAVS
jgi:hypothetical protein